MRPLKTNTAKAHKRVIDNAPADMRQRMKDIAVAALMRIYEREGSLPHYLDAEALYYDNAK